MAVINPKQLKISVPHGVNNMLEKSLKDGEGHIVSKMYDDQLGKSFYVLPGLYARNISEANLSDEIAGRLDNGLASNSIKYVVYPNDRRNGYIPIVLDRDTRFYFEEQLHELLTNGKLNWYLFKVPTDTDSDNNERAGAEMIFESKEDNQPLELRYEDIEKYLRSYGKVNDNKSSDMFDEDVEREEREQKALEQQQKEQEIDRLDIKQNVNSDIENKDVSSIKQNVDEESFDDSEQEDTDESNQNEENETENDNNDVINDEYQDVPSTNSDTLAGIFDTPSSTESTEQDDVFDSPNDTTITDNLDMFDSPSSNNETNKSQDDFVEKNSNNTESIETDESFDKYKDHPKELQELLDKIKLPKFEPFTAENLSEESRNEINYAVDNINKKIEAQENNIKDKIIETYESDMNLSYETTKQQLDVLNGKEFVQKRYKELQELINQYENEATLSSEKKLKELEDDFFNRQFEEYKAQILAELPQKFKDEFYGERVLLPNEEFKEEQLKIAGDKSQTARDEFDDWKNNVEMTALTTDKARAINHVKRIFNDEHKAFINNDVMSYKKDLEKQKYQLLTRDRVNENAKRFENRLENESIQKIMDQIAKKYGVQAADQESQISKFKKQLDQEREKYESEREREKHEIKLREERLDRENSELERRKAELDREKNNLHQQSIYQQPVVPIQSVSRQSEDQTTTETASKEHGEEKKEKKSSKLKNSIYGCIAAIGLLGIGGYIGHDISENNDNEPQQQQTQQANTSTNEQNNDSSKSTDTNEQTPYLDDGNVSVPKNDYVKGDKLQYKDKEYNIEKVSDSTLNVKDPDGKEFRVPIKEK